MMIIYILYFGYKVQECKNLVIRNRKVFVFLCSEMCILIILTVILFYSLSFSFLKVYTLFCSVAK